MNDTVLAAVRRSLSGTDEPIDDVSVVAATRRADPAPLRASALLKYADRIGDDLVGAGPLQPFLDDPDVTDVLVNGPGDVWIDRGDGLEPTSVGFTDTDEIRALAVRLAAACGRRLDDASPCVDASLPDGTRLHAVLPPIAATGPYLSLRSHATRRFDVASLVTAGTLTAESARLLRAVVAAKLSFLVSGGTGTGKTTLLGVLLGAVDRAERLVLVEDAGELVVGHPHVLRLTARAANIENVGAVGLGVLVRQALRMRPDRIIVGECRGSEILELLTALNTGHDGGAGTVHCNTAADVPARLEALALPHGVPRHGLHALITAALRVIVHMRRTAGTRVVDEIALIETDTSGERLSVVPAWTRRHGDGPAAAELTRLLAERGTVDVGRSADGTR